MALDAALRDRIQSTLDSHKVVLFMKGNAQMPRCGFSGAVVGVLSGYGVDFHTIDVLSDPDIRQGIKEFSDWPTIPQLYIDKEFVGGSDIIRQLDQAGELVGLLGVEKPSPRITITEAAAKVFLEAATSEEGVMRFEISPDFQYGLGFGPSHSGDVVVESAGVTLHLDVGTARRADGTTLDFEDGPNAGVVIKNPNEPAKVKPMGVRALRAIMDTGHVGHLYDVRTPEERATASIPGSVLLDQQAAGAIEALDKATRLIFICHHGGRSQGAAEHFLRLGFRDVHNVEGGIDAWSREIDPSVPRY